ncbi:MAG: nucleotidyltransferase family protein [Thermomicrobiales bacterium]
MIHPLVEKHLDEIVELCKEFGVARLELFGSSVTDDFEPASSDVDFLIEYGEDFDKGAWGSRIEELRAKFSATLGREVDLVQHRTIENPYVLHEIEQTRTLLYAA